MPRFLNTLGESNLAIATCARCKMKRKYRDIVSDPNSPGLRVCVFGCVDLYDPYRLPARKTENITLQYPRPDEELTVLSTTPTPPPVIVGVTWDAGFFWDNTTPWAPTPLGISWDGGTTWDAGASWSTA